MAILTKGSDNVKKDDTTVFVDKIEQHKNICSEIHTTYIKKNNDYGDAFSKTYQDLGIISAITRISDKYNRLRSLVLSNKPIMVNDESIIDTLLDMANYCIMTVMELQDEDE